MELKTAISKMIAREPESYNLDYSGVSDSWWKTRSAAIPSSVWRNYGYRTDAMILAEDAFEKVGWVYGCTRVIARNLQQIPVYAAAMGRNGKPQRLPDSHPYSQLLAHPNDEEDFSGILEGTGTHLSLRGESLWELDGALPGANGLPRPARLYVRPPQWIWKIDIENDKYARFHVRVPADGTERFIDGGSAVFYKYFNPRDPWRGMAPMKAAYQAADSYYAAQVFNAGFFERGAVPSMSLSFDKDSGFDKLTDAQRNRLEAELAKFQGLKNGFGVMVLGPHEKLDVLSSLKDMHFDTFMQRSKEEILACYGVSPLLLGGVENTNRATSGNELRSFWENTIIPLAEDVHANMDRKLAPRFGQGVFTVFDFSQVPAMRSDLESLGKGVIPFIQEGILTINYARDKYFDLPAVPWGDEWWPSGTARTPISTDALQPQVTLPGAKIDAEIGKKWLLEMKNATISRVRDGIRTPLDIFPAGREVKKAVRMFGIPQKMAYEITQAVRTELAVKWDLRAPEASVANIFDMAIGHIGEVIEARN